jgi:hypothetical protein
MVEICDVRDLIPGWWCFEKLFNRNSIFIT